MMAFFDKNLIERSKFCINLFGILLTVFSTSAWGHALAPSLLKIELQNNQAAQITWKEPLKQLKGQALFPQFPDNCRQTQPEYSLQSNSQTYRWQIQCEQGLVGNPIAVAGLINSKSYVLLEIAYTSGEQQTQVLNSANAQYVLPEPRSQLAIKFDYFTMGLQHLLNGFDHMLFIVGLLVLLQHSLKRLVLAFSCFTLGHTAALLLAVVANVSFYPPLVETLIMCSLIWMGIEVMSPTTQSMRYSIQRRPFVVTLVFGLIHGGGFANSLLQHLALSSDVVLNVIAFNIGIEAGQILVVFSCAGIIYLLKSQVQFRHALRTLLGYLMGGASTFWLLQLFVA